VVSLGTPRVATALGAVTVLLVVAALPFSELAHDASASGVSTAALTLAFSLVGVIVVRRQSRNPIGWTMIGAGFFLSLSAVAGSYAVDVYRRHYHLPLGPVLVFIQPMWAPAIFCFMLSILLFPDGTLPAGRWWRWAIGVLAVSGAVWVLGAFAISAQVIAGGKIAIEPGGDLYRIDHPTHLWRWWPVSQDVFFILGLSIALAWLVSCVPMYRRATGDRRQQLKWLLCGGALAGIGGVLGIVLSGKPGVLGVVASISLAGLFGVPLAIGVAMTKYRLYEIDRLISRTVSYTLLTGALLAVFGGLVLLTTRVLPFSSPVGVAASTLAAASLFNPLRRRLQRWVDRRFNRARYDADALVGAFSSRLRNAVDLDTVQSALLETASRAVEPAHVSVWLRE
jgi:MFS family permease